MATKPIDPHFNDRLQALRDKYAASVPERLAAIREALARCRASGPTPANIQQLHHTLHYVAGSAGSFGLRTLGDQARRVEEQVRAVMEQGVPWEGIDANVEHLLQWADNEFRTEKIAAHD